MSEIETAPGWNWTVYYLAGDDVEIAAMSVFGCMTPERAIEEARLSLGSSGVWTIAGNTRRAGEAVETEATDFEIVGIVRTDRMKALRE